VWSIVALLTVGFVIGWLVTKTDFEIMFDFFTVLRECIRNSGHHSELPVQVAAEPLDSPISSAAAKTF